MNVETEINVMMNDIMLSWDYEMLSHMRRLNKILQVNYEISHNYAKTIYFVIIMTNYFNFDFSS